MTTKTHVTTRRGFIATAGFGGTALYGLWAFYGVVPGPKDLFAPADAPQNPPGHGDHAGQEHAGHGGAAMGEGPAQPDIAAFEAEVEDFITRFAQPDGSVYPKGDTAQTAPDHGGHDMAHMGHDMSGMSMMPGMSMAGMEMAPPPEAAPMPRTESAIVVPLLAARWYYAPDHLRLEAGQRYRFRMMATDVAHGASIQFGTGAKMIRLRPGQLLEQEMVFEAPGELLVTCSFYCGAGHDGMKARISVMEGART